MSKLLHDCGEALYGPRWQSELARDLGCSIRTMQRWAIGSTDIPGGVYLDLLRLTMERAQTLDDLAQTLDDLAGRLKEAAAPK